MLQDVDSCFDRYRCFRERKTNTYPFRTTKMNGEEDHPSSAFCFIEDTIWKEHGIKYENLKQLKSYVIDPETHV